MKGDAKTNRRRSRPKTDDGLTPTRGAGFRIALLGGVFALGGLTLVARAYQLQIVRTEHYRDAAERQSSMSRTVTTKRGVIKDRLGFELALTVDVDTIFAEPRRVADPRAAAAALSPILGVPAARLAQKLESKARFRYLKRRVGPEIAAQVRALGLTGIGVAPEPKRFYSNRDLAAHVLGFTNSAGEGVAGVELAFEEQLRGRSYDVPGLRDAVGGTSLATFIPQAALEGDDLHLTINRHIQHVSELELERAVVDNGGKAGVAIVLDRASGDILALASYPSFNPNNLGKSDSDHHLNRAVSMIYEPGSTLKMVTIAAGLEEGTLTTESKIDCEDGSWTVGRRTIRDSNHKYGVLGLSDVLKLSSNICSAKIGMELGRARLDKWIRQFGFGQPTGVELPGELRGLLRPHAEWRDIALANISFGQGLSVTPMQVVQAANVIANGGILVRPRIVSAFVDKAGGRTEPERPAPARVLSEGAARALNAMMVEVTKQGGTAPTAAIPGIEVAGKTGTSQKIDPVTKAYSHSLYVASFVGYAPAADPRVVALVLVDEPKKSIYGGVVAGPAFRKIVSAALDTLGVHPEDPEARDAFVKLAQRDSMPAAAAAPVAPAEEGVEEGVEVGLSAGARALLGLSSAAASAPPTASGWERGAAEVPSEGAVADGTMPNFAGLGPREVIDRSAGSGCDLVLSGTGRVVNQSPRPGAKLSKGARCELTLAPNG